MGEWFVRCLIDGVSLAMFGQTRLMESSSELS